MKLINKPEKDDIEFFGYIPAFMMCNMGIIFILLLICIIVGVGFSLNYVQEVGLKTIVLEISTPLSAGMLAITYAILSFCWKLPDPYWLVSYLSFVAIIPANNAITLINQNNITDFKQNSTIKGWNWLAIVLGGGLMILAIIDIFMET